MIKKKIAAIAAAALAACSIGATAFATTYVVPKYSFGPKTLTPNAVPRYTSTYEKEDSKEAWVRVDQGLSTGDTFATFQVRNSDYTAATDETDLWINGEHYIDYLPGQGIDGNFYYLKYFMKSQAHADSLYVGGIWAP